MNRGITYTFTEPWPLWKHWYYMNPAVWKVHQPKALLADNPVYPKHLTEVVMEQVVEHLRGTCNSLSEGLDAVTHGGCDEEDLRHEHHVYIDGEIMRCEYCSWWSDVGDGDVIEGWVCYECVPMDDREGD